MSYGRNFHFLITPRSGERNGRYYLDSDTPLAIGAPVVLSGEVDTAARQGVEVATSAQEPPAPGTGGILVYEHIQPLHVDTFETTYSDFDTAPAGESVQVVSGTTIKVGLKNTTATSFRVRVGYPNARTMVDGVGTTPDVNEGDYLTPGVGTDADGYWAKTADLSDAWLIVTSVNHTTGEVEARLNF